MHGHYSVDNLVQDLAAIKDGDELTAVQPEICRLLYKYLQPRGYLPKLKGPHHVDIAVLKNRVLYAVVEVKRPSEDVNSTTLIQLRRYLKKTATPIGLALNGRKVFLLHGDVRTRIHAQNSHILEESFPTSPKVLGGQMKDLSEKQFKDIVVACLQDAGFFSLLRDKLYEELDEDNGPAIETPKSFESRLPKDLHELEGKALIPRSKAYAGIVASVQGGNVHLKNRAYRSLSAAARSLTGSEVNGRKWWILR